MRTKEDYLNLLEETVKFYSEDTSRRAINKNGSCKYLTENGEMCAVGRCLKHPENEENTLSVGDIIDLQQKLKEEYVGFSVEFWQYLQDLHDNTSYWNKEGLNKSGNLFVALIKRNIENGDYETNGS